MLTSRLFFAVFYIVIDVLYVFMSKGFYDAAVARITGDSKPSKNSKPFVIPVAVLTYTIMAVGWYFIVAPIAETGDVKKTVLYAVLVGLLMYGVFNGTLYALFENWTAYVAIRDLCWGLSWITTTSLLYVYFRRYKQKLT